MPYRFSPRWRLFPNPRLKVFGHLGGIILEEIELHGFGDAEEEGGVKGGFVEDFIDMVAGAGNLAGQPAHAALVAFQLLLNEVADMQGLRVCLV